MRFATAALICVTMLALLLPGGAVGAQETQCRLDWDENGVVDMEDYYRNDPPGGYFYAWWLAVYNPPFLEIIFPILVEERVDWDRDGDIDIDDLMGPVDAAAQSEGYYMQWYIYMFTPYYPIFFPEPEERCILDEVCEEAGASCAEGQSCCDGLMCCAGIPVPPGEEYCAVMCPISDRNVKENFSSIDPNNILEKVVSLPISSWNYISEDDSIRHVGPMAQDFSQSFKVGASDKHIYTIDADGVSLASIQALHKMVEELKAQNQVLTGEVKQLRHKIQQLEKNHR